MYRHSDTFSALADALAKAQAEFPVIQKNREVEVWKNGNFLYRFSYADLTTIIAAVRPVLAKHGISFTQGPMKHPDFGSGMITRLMLGAEWMELGFLPMNLRAESMKDVAGTYTYAKRLSLTAALGVAADDDVDAPLEQDEVAKPYQAPPKSGEYTTPAEPDQGANPTPPGPLHADPDKINALVESFRKVGVSTKMILRRYTIKELNEMTEAMYEDANGVGRALINKRAQIKDYFPAE